MDSVTFKTHSPLFLGIESGGTRTVAVLADDRGERLRRIEAGPANMRLMSDRALVAHFRQLAARLPVPSAIGIGMAGVLEGVERARVRAAAGQAWPGIPCWAGNDLETALAAADGGSSCLGKPRVIVISGTGSCCYGRNPAGLTAKVGGWGHVLGDRGSGYDIAVRAMRAALRDFDQNGQWPPLGTRLLRLLLLNSPNELVTWAQSASKGDLAALAIHVFEAAGQGDRMAKRIVREAAVTLAQNAAACASRLARRSSPVEFFLTGGVVTKQAGFAAVVKRRLKELWPRAAVGPLGREGAWGAVACATEEWLRSRLSGSDHQSEPLAPAAQPTYPIPASSALSPTEQRNPRSMHLDRLPLGRAVRLMIEEDARIPAALLSEHRKIERAVRLVVRTFRAGGRLYYVGAGTSGRLGVLDASECPPTFRTPPDLVQGIMAGGQTALWTSVEGAEDDAEAGAQAISLRGVTRYDIVVGIAASGRTPFVWGALHQAKALKARTVLLCFNPHLVIPRAMSPTLVIAPVVGPEILTGSTRLKAGTATKLLLNLFTTLAMVRLGKVAENLMVDLNPSNAKLQDRAVRIVMELTRADRSRAQSTLEQCGWVVTTAVARLRRRK
jgi:N-acetylmuramic acid 6-phosphate etherase